MKKLQNITHAQIMVILLMAYDAVVVNACYLMALWLRFDLKFGTIPQEYLGAWCRFTLIYMVICLIVFWQCKMYHSVWRFASYSELTRGLTGNAITFAIQCAGITVFFQRMPISYYVFGAALQVVFTIGIRFAYRFLLLFQSRNDRHGFKNHVMVIGAGAAGQIIIRDVINGGEDPEDKICCIIDDNHNKWGRYIEGIPVVGGRETIFENVKKYEINKIFFAIPSATAEERRDILQICNETGCELKQLPGLYELYKGQITVESLRDVPIEDLLGREPIQADLSEVFQFIHGKTVLVTGGGGSIGSELCRQVAGHEPKQLIIFDIYENNAYDIQLELKEKYPKLNLTVLIGSVRDSRRVNQVFETYHPDIVYHAAAHKHVPLMEDSPCETIKNNVLGTYKTAWAAMKYGADRFVLISTDKAVNPTNIMGASKRLCEMVIQTFDYLCSTGRQANIPAIYTHYDQESLLPLERDNAFSGQTEESEDSGTPENAHTRFVAVRFGNVLGSNGSVVPIFKKQIAHGGPVTVTHPDIIRYFMTVPEAVSLVMLAGTYAKGGEIFVLDMGSPVKIADLAKNLIRLSGLVPDRDIRIEYTGLRPGEKLYEEKLMAEEGLEKTSNKLIFIGKPLQFEYDEFLTQLRVLETQAYANNETEIRDYVKQVVTTYHDAQTTGQDTVNETYRKLYVQPRIEEIDAE